MLSFRQIGELNLNGTIFAAHAGRGAGLNNPAAQDQVGVGPLPLHRYLLGPWQDGAAYGVPHLGPFVCKLTPDPEDPRPMFGRDDFFIHGGDGSNPPTDSEGCVVTLPTTRHRIALAGETVLEVTP